MELEPRLSGRNPLWMPAHQLSRTAASSSNPAQDEFLPVASAYRGVVTRDDNLSCSALQMLESTRFESLSEMCRALTHERAMLLAALPDKATVTRRMPVVANCAVVGRAPNLIGLSLGDEIDNATRVFRINRFLPDRAGPPYSTKDFGARPADVDVINTWMLTKNVVSNEKPYLHFDDHCAYHGRESNLELYNPACSSHLKHYLRCTH